MIATPGRLLDFADRGKILLTGIEILVIDEADRMLDMGFIPDIERICKLVPFTRQTLFFSATMPPEITRLTEQFLQNPVRVEVSRPASTAVNIAQTLVKSGVSPEEKRATLRRLVRSADNFKNAIIFCNRKRDVQVVYRSLEKHGFSVGALHGDMDQRARMAALESFRNDSVQLLVCSDVAARGLDIPDVSHIINYDAPHHAEDYVHRIGRTGRAGKTGVAMTLATRLDAKAIEEIEKLIARKIDWAPGAAEVGGRSRGRGARTPPRTRPPRAHRGERSAAPRGGRPEAPAAAADALSLRRRRGNAIARAARPPIARAAPPRRRRARRLAARVRTTTRLSSASATMCRASCCGRPACPAPSRLDCDGRGAAGVKRREVPMFTGIVSDVGEVVEMSRQGDIARLVVDCGYDASGVALGASIANAGVCLTVVARSPRNAGARLSFDVGAETLAVTTLGELRAGQTRQSRAPAENRRRTRRPSRQRPCRRRRRRSSRATISRAWRISASARRPRSSRFIATKGSVALDGTSLTVNAVEGDEFEVLLIPHTLAVTTWGERRVRRPRQSRSRPDGALRRAARRARLRLSHSASGMSSPAPGEPRVCCAADRRVVHLPAHILMVAVFVEQDRRHVVAVEVGDALELHSSRPGAPMAPPPISVAPLRSQVRIDAARVLTNKSRPCRRR